jgi:hypothetical protein
MNQHPSHLPIVVAERPHDSDFCAWLHRARRGACIEYHRGYLAIDRARNLSALGEVRRKKCAEIADEAYSAAMHNMVHLLQRRVAPDVFSYMAIAR